MQKISLDRPSHSTHTNSRTNLVYADRAVIAFATLLRQEVAGTTWIARFQPCSIQYLDSCIQTVMCDEYGS